MKTSDNSRRLWGAVSTRVTPTFPRLHFSLIGLCLIWVQFAAAQGTAFTYQGQLNDGGTAADGTYDMQFKVFNDVSSGTQQGSTLTQNDLPVSNGLFTVTLDFGTGIFTGSSRWLQIEVRPGASGAGHTILSPRQALTPSPYAVYAGGANAANLTGTVPPASLDPSIGLWTASGGNIYRNPGMVGIGTTAPDDLLHIYGGSAGTVAAQGSARLVVEDDATAFINILTPAANERGILFGDPDNNSNGGIVFNNGNTPEGLQLRTGGNATRVAIASDGNVGIGVTAPLARLQVAGSTVLTRTGGPTPSSGTISNMLNLSVGVVADGLRNGISFYESAANPALALGYDGTGAGDNNALRIYGGVAMNPLFAFELGGNLGIGITNPSTRLHVAGDVRIDGTITVEPTIRYLTMSAAGFEASGDAEIESLGAVPYVVSRSVDPLVTVGYGHGRMALPHGATVLELVAVVRDTAPDTELTVQLTRTAALTVGGAATVMASVATVATPGTTTLTDATIASATIDNENYYYYVLVTLNDSAIGGTDLEFHRVRIKYEVTAPLP